MPARTAECSLRDIAKELGISYENVRLIEKRALAKMAAVARREKMLCAEMFDRAAKEAEGKHGG